MQPSRRQCLCASLALLASFSLASRTRAENLTITSSPSGASVEIGGLVAGITPYKTDFPGGYFHKTHTVFGARLQHSLILKVSMDGYLSQQITLTEGPFEWVAVNGRHHGSYFLLKSERFDVKLDPISIPRTPVETIGSDGPLRPAAAFSEPNSSRPDQIQPAPRSASVTIESDPSGAEIYADGKFVGQTPSTIHLASGSHRIEVKSRGREAWSRDLEVFKDSQITLHPVLSPAP